MVTGFVWGGNSSFPTAPIMPTIISEPMQQFWSDMLQQQRQQQMGGASGDLAYAFLNANGNVDTENFR